MIWKSDVKTSEQHLIEFVHAIQPENFSSITESFWWSVASLTGVGFKEIFPLTIGGKIFGTIISLIGVGVVAVPTGIISASFVRIIKQHK